MSCFQLFFDFLNAECAGVFHRGGARLILCGKSWETLEELADDLEKASDPTVVSIPALKTRQIMTDRSMCAQLDG